MRGTRLCGNLRGCCSQLPLALHLLMLLAVLRCAEKHLDKVVVQAIEDLPLEGPLELWIVEIAWVKLKVVGVHRRIGKARPDDELDGFALGPRVELDEGMFIQPELLLHALKPGAHPAIVAES